MTAAISIDRTYLADSLHHGLMAAVGGADFFGADAVVPPEAAVFVAGIVLDGHLRADFE